MGKAHTPVFDAWVEKRFGVRRAKKFSAEEKLKSKAVAHERRARDKGAAIESSVSEVHDWLTREKSCAYCGAPAAGLDHIVPLSKGGVHSVENFQPLCRTCNTIKLDLLERDLYEHLLKVLPVLKAKVAS